MRILVDECCERELVAALRSVRHRLPSAGIVLLRIDPLNRVKRAKALTKAIERFGEQLRRQLTVVRANVVRVRLLDP